MAHAYSIIQMFFFTGTFLSNIKRFSIKILAALHQNICFARLIADEGEGGGEGKGAGKGMIHAVLLHDWSLGHKCQPIVFTPRIFMQ